MGAAGSASCSKRRGRFLLRLGSISGRADLRRSFGQRGLRFVRQQYSKEAPLAAVKKLYEELARDARTILARSTPEVHKQAKEE